MAEPGVTTCTVVLDLVGVPWAGDPTEVERMLRSRTGVLAARAEPDGRRVRVTYDVSRQSLPDLWNWLVEERRPAGH